MKHKLHKLEAIRGFAAVYVVFHHLFSQQLLIGGHNFSFLFKFGQEAVILFFILSGFVIKYSFELSRDKSFNDYFLKRFLRIYIPLFIIFITNYLLVVWQQKHLISVDIKNLFGNLFMLQDASFLKPNVICDPLFNNTPLWSLSYEWWFYMLFFIINQNLLKRTYSFVGAIGIVSAFTYLVYPFFLNRLFMYLCIWWAGVVIAEIYLKGKEINFKNLQKSFYILIGCLLILLINARINIYNNLPRSIGVSPYLEVRHFGFAIVAISIAIIWKKFHWKFFSSTIGLFEPLATISFGIYISHYFLIVNATYLNFINNRVVEVICYSVICLAYAFLVERILYIHLKKLFIRKKLVSKSLPIVGSPVH